MSAQKYDPTWLVALAEQQLPSELWLHTALAACVEAAFDEESVITFVDRLEGKFDRNVHFVLPGRRQGCA